MNYSLAMVHIQTCYASMTNHIFASAIRRFLSLTAERCHLLGYARTKLFTGLDVDLKSSLLLLLPLDPSYCRRLLTSHSMHPTVAESIRFHGA